MSPIFRFARFELDEFTQHSSRLAELHLFAPLF